MWVVNVVLRTRPCTQEMLCMSYFYLLQLHSWLVGWSLTPLWDSEAWRTCIHQLVGCRGPHSGILLSHCFSSSGVWEKICPFVFLSHSLCMHGKLPSVWRMVTSSYPQESIRCISPWQDAADNEIDRLCGGHDGTYSVKQANRSRHKMSWKPKGYTNWALERSGKTFSRRWHI